MRPALFKLPYFDLPVHSYGAMIVLGFLLSIWLGSREVRRRGLEPIVYDLGLVMLLTGLVGARIFYVVLRYDDFL
jgi:phosphatidylglycerol:prolipoprotein diacylglycerol transferase